MDITFSIKCEGFSWLNDCYRDPTLLGFMKKFPEQFFVFHYERCTVQLGTLAHPDKASKARTATNQPGTRILRLVTSHLAKLNKLHLDGFHQPYLSILCSQNVGTWQEQVPVCTANRARFTHSFLLALLGDRIAFRRIHTVTTLYSLV